MEWCEVGSAIVQVERNYQWWVGDSWAFGEHAYSLFGRRERDGWTVWGDEAGDGALVASDPTDVTGFVRREIVPLNGTGALRSPALEGL